MTQHAFCPSWFYWSLLLIQLTALRGYAQSWLPTEDIPSEHVFSLCATHERYFTVTDTSIYSSLDKGITWSKEISPSTDKELHFTKLFCRNDRIYLGTTNQGLWISDDHAQSWSDFNTGLSGLALNIVDITHNGDTLLVGTNGGGIFARVIGQSTSWQSFNQGVQRRQVSAIDVSNNFLVAGIGLYSFIRPVDGTAWSYMPWNELESSREATDFITMGKYTLAGTHRGLYRADLNVEPWQDFNIRQFPGRMVKFFARSGPMIFAGIDLNYAEYFICTSVDTGYSWEVRAHEFAELHALTVLDGKLWAGRSDGLWYFDLKYWTATEPTPQPRPSPTVQLHPNQPNPFHSSTTLSFELSSPQKVTILVYDITGRKVAILANQTFFTSGRHHLPFMASNLPSGVYVYRLTTQEGIYAQKMFLIR